MVSRNVSQHRHERHGDAGDENEQECLAELAVGHSSILQDIVPESVAAPPVSRLRNSGRMTNTPAAESATRRPCRGSRGIRPDLASGRASLRDRSGDRPRGRLLGCRTAVGARRPTSSRPRSDLRDLSCQLGAARTQGDVFAAQLAGDGYRLSAGRQGACDILETPVSASAPPAASSRSRRPWLARSRAATCTSSCSRPRRSRRHPLPSRECRTCSRTRREPGRRSMNLSRSLPRLSGSRKSAITVALEMSAAYMSPSMNVALSATPGLLGQPIATAPPSRD